jgi:hypothetical protein
VRNIASKNTIMRNGIAADAVVFVRSGTVVSEREQGSLLELAEAESVQITSGAARVR